MTDHDKYLMAVCSQYTDGAITAYEFLTKITIYGNEHHASIKAEHDSMGVVADAEYAEMEAKSKALFAERKIS